MNWYQLTKEQVLEKLGVTKDGLSSKKAEELLQKNGENVLQEGKRKTALQVFLSQFADLLVIILIIAAIISMFSGNIESTIVIFAVITLNAILGTVQHINAEKSLDSLKSLSSPNAKVIRDGQKIEIPSKEVVEGDMVVLEAGDLVVADGRIMNNYSLQVNESSLTGESTNVDKNDDNITAEVPLADRTNMVYSGSLVTYGRAIVAVTGTGMNTEIGKIASLMNAAKEKKTPLQESLDKFSSKLAIIILIISALVFGLSLLNHMAIIDALMFAVALAVAAIPEALGSIVTIVQAIGTQKMAKENAVIKDLKAVESLGCVSVICSDKTGTLTQNKMTVQKIYINGESIFEEELDLNNQSHRYLLYDMVLNNDSSIVDGKGIGDPTEYALLETLRKLGYNEDDLRSGLKRLEEVPFDSDRKMMSTKYKLHGVNHILTKGAIDAILDRCDSIAAKDGVRPITQADKADILKQNTEYSENGLRVLTFAYKESDEELNVNTEYGYTFLGLVSMIDPPREESKAAVADAVRAGIKPVMITGDHKITATAIARQIGIFREGDIAVTGMELDAMSDSELDQKIEKISVYARVSPENKIRIVEAWQRKGNIVSMTGDGVNDAPALKKADIGVAMGITGTEVSKDAASMVLQDDNFATIVDAVREGRGIYANIKKVVGYLLGTNIGEVITVFTAMMLWHKTPLLSMQLLWINLVTDSLPAIALGMEAVESEVMTQKPKPKTEGLFAHGFGVRIVLQGVMFGLLALFAFMIGEKSTGTVAGGQTMAFGVLALSQVIQAYNMRSEHSLFKIGMFTNKKLNQAALLSIVLVLAVLFTPLRIPFGLELLSLNMYLTALGMVLIPILVMEFSKAFGLIRHQH